ncbi:MAG TPA: TonB-dependent receptor [Terriglobales bacterium]|nr:TonB-dependent receptor [Terriglobales bacterium]
MRLRLRVHAVVLLALMVVFASGASAQTDSATVSGKVTDSTGAAIVGADVTATNVDTNVSISAKTNDVGLYVINGLKPGTYRLIVARDGFQSITLSRVVLNVQDSFSRNFELHVGSRSETINVVADGAQVNTQDATVSTVVDRQFVENIPLNGRSFQSLILLSPGVVMTKATFGEQGQFSINGQRANANYYTVDGVSANFSINAGGGTGQAGAGELPATNTAGGFSNLVSVDALQEFRIQTSTYAPEFGRSPGGQISLATRSGTNSFHGTAFDYLRNDVLDANDWFANHATPKPLPKAKQRQNDFGGVFGGPIVKNKTFFFFSYEGLRLRQPATVTSTVPSNALRNNPLLPLAMRPLLAAFPIPNSTDLGNGLALFTATYSDPTNFNATSLRLDHQMSKVTLFARYDYAPSTFTANLGGTQPNNPRPTRFGTRTLTAGANWLITPTMTNEFRANWSRQNGGTFLTMNDLGGAVPLTNSILPSSVPPDTFFSLFILNTATTSLNLGRNGEGTQGQLNFVDNFSLGKSNHQVRFGVDHRYLFPSAYSRSGDLQLLFTSQADILASRVSQVFTATRKSPVDYAYTNFSAYGQDTWRISEKLTATYGLRWDVDPPPHGRNNTTIFAANQTDDPATIGFAPAGTPMWETTWGDVAPRLGLAYRPWDKRSTVIRGGFGIFYDLPAGTISNVVILSPNVNSATALGVAYPLNPAAIPFAPLSTTGPFSNVLFADRHTKLPYTRQWNLALETSAGANDKFTLSYVGAAGRRLIRQERYFNLNANFPLVQIDRSAAASDYEAAQAQYQRRLAHGLQALASYTWSHSIDNGSNDSTAVPAASKINFDAERGPSDFDVRHSFSSALTYDIPVKGPAVVRAIFGNWATDAIFTARTATPVDVTYTRNLGFGSFAFRPDLVPGVPFYITGDACTASNGNQSCPGGQRITNTPVSLTQVGPFAVPAQLRQGTLGRNALRGFANNQLNFSMRRQLKLSERVNLQYRAEFFNIFNHPNFADPAGSLGSVNAAGTLAFSSGTFGKSPTMLNRSLGTGGQTGGFAPLYGIGGPRSIQMSLKLSF